MVGFDNPSNIENIELNHIDTYDDSKVIGINKKDELVYELTNRTSNIWMRLGNESNQYISVGVGNNQSIYGLRKDATPAYIYKYNPETKVFASISSTVIASKLGPGSSDVFYIAGNAVQALKCKEAGADTFKLVGHGVNYLQFQGTKHTACGKTLCLSVDKNHDMRFFSSETCPIPGSTFSASDRKMIIVDLNEANQIWGIEFNTGNVFYRVGITPSNKHGVKWINIPGIRLTGIAVGKMYTYGITKEHRLVYFGKFNAMEFFFRI